MGSRIIGFIAVLALGVLTAPLLANAQQTGKTYRIGYLRHSPGPSAADAAFFQALHDYGWIEGQNLAIEYHWKVSRRNLPLLTEELVRQEVDLFVVTPSFTALAAKKATTTIPIVTLYAADAVENGIVPSLAHPGGNVTGMSESLADLYTKLLEILHETLPKAKRVAFLLESQRKAHVRASKRLLSVAPAAGVAIQILKFRSSEELEKVLQIADQGAVDALVVPGPLYTRYGQQISDFTIENRLPVFSVSSQPRMEKHFILLVYAPDWSDMARQAATYVDKILRGTEPADLPIGRPTKFDLVVNLKTAKALGITIPPIILYQATRVIR